MEIKYTSTPEDSWFKRHITTSGSIAQCHIERIGLARTFFGGTSMYLGIPFFITFNLTAIAILFNLVLTPLLKLKKSHWRNYIILDRHKINTLPPLDRLNCLYCGYANGLGVLTGDKLDEIGQIKEKDLSTFQKITLSIIVPLSLPVFILFEQIGINIIYDIFVSRPLNLKRTSYCEVRKQVQENNYAANLSNFHKNLFHAQKAFSIRLSNLLEQIEAAWCPLKHLDKRPEARYPDHHERFFEVDQLDEMKKVLRTVGSA